MGVRSTVKALILNDGKILLNKCVDKNNGDYYSLPGGGQHQYETIYQALVRECLEETGYTIIPIKLVGLCEEISMSEESRKNFPEYAHKMYHVFLCELEKNEKQIPTEKDEMQINSEWISINILKEYRILPKIFGENIQKILGNNAPIFLGSEYININHG